MPQDVHCPTCGAVLPVSNPGVLMVVCEYCRNAIYWEGGGITHAGKQSVLSEGFTRLYRGAAGALRGKRFVVLGRIRYSFGQGFWDEWFIEFEDGSTAWVTEDNHELALEAVIQSTGIPSWESLAVGGRVSVDGQTFVIEEKGEAECLGMEGELLERVETGERYPYADGSSLDGRYTLGLEYDGEWPTVFKGEWIAHEELVLDDEGEDW